MAVRFKLNGVAREVSPRPGETLLETLRDRCGITSVKDGCTPQGQCGCCLALIDGNPKVTCAMPAEKAHGVSIVTLDGIPQGDRDLLARAFAASAAVQCGFCIPGIALRAAHLVDHNPNPTHQEIARAIDVHLCRCTGYVKIIDAIDKFARARRGEGLPELCDDGRVGQRLTRYQATRSVLGDRPYVADMTRPGMLHGAVVLSSHARARVGRIDISRAKAFPGVVAVATAKDVPGNRWYGLLYDDWPGFVAEGEEARSVGDVIAAVAAVDRHTAREAAKLVDVDYEPLAPVLDPEDALKKDAPQVNPKHPNLLSESIIKRGDVDVALEASAHVVSGTWKT